MIGKYCVVRTKSAGVFAGTVAKRDGQEVVLTNARRVWSWDGTGNMIKMMMTSPVAEVLLFGVIEILPITE